MSRAARYPRLLCVVDVASSSPPVAERSRGMRVSCDHSCCSCGVGCTRCVAQGSSLRKLRCETCRADDELRPHTLYDHISTHCPSATRAGAMHRWQREEHSRAQESHACAAEASCRGACMHAYPLVLYPARCALPFTGKAPLRVSDGLAFCSPSASPPTLRLSN